MVSDKLISSIVDIYRQAWEEQDSTLLDRIFHEDAVYQEFAFDPPFEGIDQIKEYWVRKVQNDQANICFKLLNTYICESSVICEWECDFDKSSTRNRVGIREVAILKIKDGKIAHLREYWASHEIAKYA